MSLVSDTAGENIRKFKYRSRYAPESGLTTAMTHHFLYEGMIIVVLGKNVMNTFGRLVGRFRPSNLFHVIILIIFKTGVCHFRKNLEQMRVYHFFW
jgi:hypothetical protein